MLVRVIVLAGTMVDLTARVAALDLDRRMSDREPFAQATFEVTDDVLRVTKRDIIDDDVAAERCLVGRERPHVEVVHAG